GGGVDGVKGRRGAEVRGCARGIAFSCNSSARAASAEPMIPTLILIRRDALLARRQCPGSAKTPAPLRRRRLRRARCRRSTPARDNPPNHESQNPHSFLSLMIQFPHPVPAKTLH